ncbi:MAG: hypothetical protein QNL04_01080 [SAR324 cluster bacterium]|nr:hypothetical protein [SAR324 cluster bacterium]
MKNRKVVDLIYVEPHASDLTLYQDHKTKLDLWIQRMIDGQEAAISQDDSGMEKVSEFAFGQMCLQQMAVKRLEWIQTKVTDQALKHKYLMVLPPFPQKNGLKTLLTHFFLCELNSKNQLVFSGKTNQEKELNILWDIYKLRKTLESIHILEKSLKEEGGFPSIFTKAEILKNLDQLKKSFMLLFRMCIVEDQQKALLKNFSLSHFKPEAMLERLESGEHLVRPNLINQYDYRNHFFYIYYQPGMKAKENGKEYKFEFNFLDFEIIKQEFLSHWVCEKLQNNPKKDEIYINYMLGEESISEILEKNPKRELELLKKLPLNLFNDILAGFQGKIAEPKLPFDPMSEEVGEFAESFTLFHSALEIAKKPASFLKNMFTKKSFEEAIDFDAPLEFDSPEKQEASEPNKKEEGTTESPKSKFTVKRLTKEEISFPFLVASTSEFNRKLVLLQSKMTPPKYQIFNNRIRELFTTKSDNAFCKRRTPKHEWTLPYMFTETEGAKITEHLLILGAEVKTKELSMGYGSKDQDQKFSFTGYYVYGSSASQYGLTPIEGRNVRGSEIHVFDATSPDIINLVEKLLPLIK